MPTREEYLVHSQNADGGWGYRVPGMSFVEPTSAAILAISGPGGAPPETEPVISDALDRARSYLRALQQPDGGWGISAIDAESGWMTAWAMLALGRDSASETAVSRGADWLLTIEGMRLTDAGSREVIRRRLQIDSALSGWPWQPGDAAWVHPTALAMLALCAAGRREAGRVRDGVAYLFDRADAHGGWNIGNPEMLGKQIPATIQDTAVALLALRQAGIGSDEPHVASAIKYLTDAVAQAQTAAELAWGAYGLRGWGVNVDAVLANLDDLQSAEGSWAASPFVTSAALLAHQNGGT